MQLPRSVVTENLAAMLDELADPLVRKLFDSLPAASIPCGRLHARVLELGWTCGREQFVELILSDAEALAAAGQLFGALSALGIWELEGEP